jgi:hypothetical protein
LPRKNYRSNILTPPSVAGGKMAKRRTPEERYRERIRAQQTILEDYAAHEIEWADDLLLWYQVKRLDRPDDEYRAVAVFKNREYLRKPGSLTLLYSMYQRMNKELPEAAKENAFHLLAYRYKVYSKTLEKGGYNA